MSGFAPNLRTRSLATLKGGTVDVLIMGGGINGAGVARDLCLRQSREHPLTVAVVERDRFAAGASGRNSQLIHGGLRYLKYMKFGLVKEALHERLTLRKLAPHLVKPMTFLLPTYGRIDWLKYLFGLALYDRLAGPSNIGRHRFIRKGEIQLIEPAMNTKGLTGGAVFYDCAIHSARFVLENLFDAAAHGALIANYTSATPMGRDEEGLFKVQIEDNAAGTRFMTRARKIVDARGPWSTGEMKPRLVRGSHLILPRLNNEEHAVAYFDTDGRVIFFIPWGHNREFTLLGTTDIEHRGGPDDVRISEYEVRYLLGIAEKLYPNLSPFKPVAAYSSLRPLVDDAGSSATSASREHRIWNSADGILRIRGGKYTTYRVMSEEAADLVTREVRPELEKIHKTGTEPLAGNTEEALVELREQTDRLARAHRLLPAEVAALIDDYGVHAPSVFKFLQPDENGMVSRLTFAKMAAANYQEMALRLSDYMFVSTYTGYETLWDEQSLLPFAEAMGKLMGWNQKRREVEAEDVRQQVAIPQ